MDEGKIETGLIEIWKDMLDVETVLPDDNFLSLGGNSMMALRILAQVNARFGIKLPTQVLFECSTVRELTAAIQAAGKP